MKTIDKFEGLDLSAPISLRPTRAWRTYLGGKLISKLHGEDDKDDHFPEEWLMSAVSARNSGREHIIEGLTYLTHADCTLKDLIEAYPTQMLGKDHPANCGNSPGVLVKLLDAAERLTLQAHPTRETAAKLFNSPFGKTECWHIIGTRVIDGQEPCVYFGFKEGITREYWKNCFNQQDIPAMLDCLHRIPVKEGDTFIIRGGIPHGIGAGCFLVEIQEPTDYTVRTERTTPSGLQVADSMCHQGLGFEKMFDCFEYDGLSLENTLASYRVEPQEEAYPSHTISHIIHSGVTDLFALDVLKINADAQIPCAGRFSGLYVLEGEGTLNGVSIKPCDHYFIPAACKQLKFGVKEGKTLKLVRCFGPHYTKLV